MDINEANWKKTRHESAKASGIAEAARNWVKCCLPADKLDEKTSGDAMGVAESLRTAIKKAGSSLKVDAKLEKAYNEHKRANPKDEKGKKKLAEAKQAFEEDEKKVKATRELLKDWDDQASKYIRSVMKSDEERKKKLEMHKKEVASILEMYKSISRTSAIGQKRLEEGIRALTNLALRAEKELSQAMTAKKAANMFALNTVKKNAGGISNDLKKEHSATKQEVETIIKQMKRQFPSPKPYIEHSLTNKKLQDQLRKDADRVDGEISVLAESLPKLDDAFDEVKLLLDKIEKASTEGLDDAQEVKDQLLRTLKRGSEQLRQAKAIVEIGIGGLLEQAGLEIINLEEGKPKTNEERAKVWESADTKLKRAANNMSGAESTLERVTKMFEQVRSAIPDNVQKNPQGELAPLIQELGLQELDLAKYVKAQEENVKTLDKRQKKLSGLSKTI